MNRYHQALAAAAVFIAGSQAHAIPIQLTSGQFQAATSGLTVAIEDFEGYAAGGVASPFTFSNATFTSLSPLIAGPGLFCTTGNCLLDSTQQGTVSARTFSGFASGTNYFATDLTVLRTTDLFDVTVMGNSGTLTLSGVSLVTSGQLGFAGFYDSLGLISVSFTNIGTPGGGIANYSFDNISTATASVPEPTTLSLLGAGLLGLGLMRRRRKVA